jgi:hypothetical protein
MAAARVPVGRWQPRQVAVPIYPIEDESRLRLFIRSFSPLIDAPVLANGRLELRWYLREQTVSRVLHRYGSLTEPVVSE